MNWTSVRGEVFFGKTDTVTHEITKLRFQFLGNLSGNRGRRHPSRLGAGDLGFASKTGFPTELGKLRGLAGTGLSGNDQDLMRLEVFLEFFGVEGNRKLFRNRNAGA